MIGAIADPVDGLGLTVFRYNIGGGDDPAHDHMRAGAEIPGFRPGPDAPLDPEADPRQRRVLLGLLEAAEAPIVEAFSNSPPYWMTRSGCASGGEEGGPNLPDDRIDEFADYLVDVVELYRDRYGVAFRTIDPFNEPNETWWTAGGSQEGCRFTPAQMERVIASLNAALAERGLAETTVIAATDGHGIEHTLRNFRGFDTRTLELIGQINTHTYRGADRAGLRSFADAAGKRLWQSESGPMGLPIDRRPRSRMVVPLKMMERLALDLNELRPAAWVMWQFLDDAHAWGCGRIGRDGASFDPTPMFWLHAQYTRHVRPGARILPTSDPAVVAAITPDGASLIAVVVNPEPRRRAYRVALGEISPSAGRGRAFRTSAEERHAPVTAHAVRGASIRIDAAPMSVTTIVAPLTRR